MPLDYIHSKYLVEIEKGINKTVEGIVLSKKVLCIALARVKNEELYRQAGNGSFKEYLKSQRLNIAYSTAIEYCRIGEIFLEYKGQLERIEFREEHGLKKLLHPPKAFSTHNSKSFSE